MLRFSLANVSHILFRSRPHVVQRDRRDGSRNNFVVTAEFLFVPCLFLSNSFSLQSSVPGKKGFEIGATISMS